MRDLAAIGIHPIALEVTDEESATSAVERIMREQGRIDVLVNNAGYGSYGALEEVPMQEARAQIEVIEPGSIRTEWGATAADPNLRWADHARGSVTPVRSIVRGVFCDDA